MTHTPRISGVFITECVSLMFLFMTKFEFSCSFSFGHDLAGQPSFMTVFHNEALLDMCLGGKGSCARIKLVATTLKTNSERRVTCGIISELDRTN